MKITKTTAEIWVCDCGARYFSEHMAEAHRKSHVPPPPPPKKPFTAPDFTDPNPHDYLWQNPGS